MPIRKATQAANRLYADALASTLPVADTLLELPLRQRRLAKDRFEYRNVNGVEICNAKYSAAPSLNRGNGG
ncbi:MAG TPA: hypothetical protein VF255_05535 [Solirubrobacterales bacterium]